MTKEDILEINSKLPSSEQGIYTEPSMIPVHIKEPVIYSRYETGGMSGCGIRRIISNEIKSN